jgi:hypothetical protein
LKRVEGRLGVANISLRSRYQFGDIQRGVVGQAGDYPAPRNNAHGHRPHALTINYGSSTPTTRQLRRPRANTLPSFISDHQTWFDDTRFDGSFPSRVLPFLYLGNLYVISCVVTSDILNIYAGITPRMYICSTPSESHTSSPSANVLSYPHLKRLPPPLHPPLIPHIPLTLHSPRGTALEIKVPSGLKNAKDGSKFLTSKGSATTASTRSSPNSTPSAPGSRKRGSQGAACWCTAAWACPGAQR